MEKTIIMAAYKITGKGMPNTKPLPIKENQVSSGLTIRLYLPPV
jgi:hypothetical protein